MINAKSAPHRKGRSLTIAAFVAVYACQALQFIRFYTRTTISYLNMPAYLSGHERLPFQERVLPVLFIKPLMQSSWVMQHVAHANGAFTVDRGPFYLLSLIAFAFAAVYTQKLYSLLTPNRLLSFLVFPVFLFAVMWSYCIHSEANFSYPYDMPSLAFFTAGLYYIFARRFPGLLLVMIVGTFNRETTLFLIGIYILDSASRTGFDQPGRLQGLGSRFNLKLIPWSRVVLLTAVWLAIKLALVHRFAENDASESFLRIHYNLVRLKPRLLPALLNVCGYTLPLVLIFARYLRPTRFANYLFILFPWFAIMFCSGVLVETRVYGELCSFCAIALVLIMEHRCYRLVSREEHLRSENISLSTAGYTSPSPPSRYPEEAPIS